MRDLDKIRCLYRPFLIILFILKCLILRLGFFEFQILYSFEWFSFVLSVDICFLKVLNVHAWNLQILNSSFVQMIIFFIFSRIGLIVFLRLTSKSFFYNATKIHFECTDQWLMNSRKVKVFIYFEGIKLKHAMIEKSKCGYNNKHPEPRIQNRKVFIY